MKIALIGYGKMGHMIEEIALQRGHEIVCKIDVNNPEDIDTKGEDHIWDVIRYKLLNVASEISTMPYSGAQQMPYVSPPGAGQTNIKSLNLYDDNIGTLHPTYVKLAEMREKCRDVVSGQDIIKSKTSY